MNFSATELIERIKEFTPLKNLDVIGFSQNTINNWKFRNAIPKADDLYKIAQYCGCTMEYLLTGQKIDDDNIFLSAREQSLLHDYKLLDNDDKSSVDRICKALTGK